MDIFSPEKRSDIMSRIRATGTKPEEQLRKELFRRGYRYRKNVRSLKGCPDIAFRSRRVAVFVHGCFWHQHAECKYAVMPKSHQEYWQPKLVRNAKRDEAVRCALEADGWQVVVVWECEVKRNLQGAADHIEAVLRKRDCGGSA